MFPATIGNVGFENYNSGDYELRPSSPYKGKGGDGLDPGADIVGLNQALSGVE